MHQLPTSVSAAVIVRNSSLKQIPLTKIPAAQYMPDYRAEDSHRTRRRTGTSECSDAHPTILYPLLGTSGASRFQRPGSIQSSCIGELKRCSNSHGLTDHRWTLLLYLGRQLSFLMLAILEKRCQLRVRAFSGFTTVTALLH